MSNMSRSCCYMWHKTILCHSCDLFFYKEDLLAQGWIVKHSFSIFNLEGYTPETNNTCAVECKVSCQSDFFIPNLPLLIQCTKLDQSVFSARQVNREKHRTELKNKCLYNLVIFCKPGHIFTFVCSIMILLIWRRFFCDSDRLAFDLKQKNSHQF